MSVLLVARQERSGLVKGRGVSADLIDVAEGVVICKCAVLELLKGEGAGTLNVDNVSVDYCVDVAFDAVDFDFGLLVGDFVPSNLCEVEEDAFVDVTDEELEESVRFETLFRLIFLRMKFKPELTIRLAEVRHAKGRLTRHTSITKTSCDHVGKFDTEVSSEFVIWVTRLLKESVDVFNKSFNLLSNIYLSYLKLVHGRPQTRRPVQHAHA